MSKYDIPAILANCDIVNVIGRRVYLKKQGTEHVGICPFHDDSKASLKVNAVKQKWACFACGVHGDAIDFLTQLGLPFKDALAEITGEVDPSTPTVKRATKTTPRPEVVKWRQTDPPAGRHPEIRHYKHGEPSMYWAYKSASGAVTGYICRFDLEDGTKDVVPFIYATDGTRSEWRWHGFDRPRPLYNMDQLINRPEATVIVVEGEKTADAAAMLYPDQVVTTWQGGSNAVQATDFSPLEGRVVILWPDNDFTHRYGEKHAKAGRLKPFHEQPGNKAMFDIYDLIKDKATLVKWMTNPPETPCGWDVADAEDWTAESAKTYARLNMVPVPDRPEPGFEVEEEAEVAPPPPVASAATESAHDTHAQPFTILGYSKEGGSTQYHFYSHATRTVISFFPSGMQKNNLLQLAPLNWWEGTQYCKGGRIKSEAVANWLMSACAKRGIFTERNIRGRGAWIDGDKVVVHNGNEVLVDGRHTEFSAHKSRYIYEFSEPLGLSTDKPLSNKEAAQLRDILTQLNWDRDVNAYLLAGFCVVAPICGALEWRPHIWLTGAAGTGKSWVFKKIVRKLLGDTCIAVQGGTTEPGLRQVLGHDALPVVFDEAEGENQGAQQNMQNVISLMRAASADDGGIMAKGSAGGTAKTYRIRSCFAFASISMQVTQQSDRSRVTVLGMFLARDKDRVARFEAMAKMHLEVITDEWVRRLQARTIRLVPVIIDNARVFATAAAAVIGEQRAGDQLGALLAGAYSLTSDKRISLDEAVAWVKARNWDEEKGLDRTRDEYALLGYLMDQEVRVETRYTNFNRTISEVIAIANNVHPEPSDITMDGAKATLLRHGFKVIDGQLQVSNTSNWILKRLEGKPWAKNHNKILLRLDGAEAVPSTRFGPGLQTRAVSVPLALLFDNP